MAQATRRCNFCNKSLKSVGTCTKICLERDNCKHHTQYRGCHKRHNPTGYAKLTYHYTVFDSDWDRIVQERHVATFLVALLPDKLPENYHATLIDYTPKSSKETFYVNVIILKALNALHWDCDLEIGEVCKVNATYLEIPDSLPVTRDLIELRNQVAESIVTDTNEQYEEDCKQYKADMDHFMEDLPDHLLDSATEHFKSFYPAPEYGKPFQQIYDVDFKSFEFKRANKVRSANYFAWLDNAVKMYREQEPYSIVDADILVSNMEDMIRNVATHVELLYGLETNNKNHVMYTQEWTKLVKSIKEEQRDFEEMKRQAAREEMLAQLTPHIKPEPAPKQKPITELNWEEEFPRLVSIFSGKR